MCRRSLGIESFQMAIETYRMEESCAGSEAFFTFDPEKGRGTSTGKEASGIRGSFLSSRGRTGSPGKHPATARLSSGDPQGLEEALIAGERKETGTDEEAR